jgi:hypothetical protein
MNRAERRTSTHRTPTELNRWKRHHLNPGRNAMLRALLSLSMLTAVLFAHADVFACSQSKPHPHGRNTVHITLDPEHITASSHRQHRGREALVAQDVRLVRLVAPGRFPMMVYRKDFRAARPQRMKPIPFVRVEKHGHAHVGHQGHHDHR